jgi:hypothetical protein
MRRVGIGLLCAIAGYLIAAIAGYFMITQFSSNMHDRSVEASMTSIFVFGPLGAVIAFIVGFIRARRPSSAIAPRS